MANRRGPAHLHVASRDRFTSCAFDARAIFVFFCRSSFFPYTHLCDNFGSQAERVTNIQYLLACAGRRRNERAMAAINTHLCGARSRLRAFAWPPSAVAHVAVAAAKGDQSRALADHVVSPKARFVDICGNAVRKLSMNERFRSERKRQKLAPKRVRSRNRSECRRILSEPRA